MDSSLKNEINRCITDLNSIARKLDEAADEVTLSIKGMNTKRYSDAIKECAEKYRQAARRLSNIQ